jgi:hypothetical protein
MRSIDAHLAAGLLAGFGVDGDRPANVARMVAHHAASWMQQGDQPETQDSTRDAAVVVGLARLPVHDPGWPRLSRSAPAAPAP